MRPISKSNRCATRSGCAFLRQVDSQPKKNSIDQADRGELLDGEEVIARLLARHQAALGNS
ncbi:hypothetical protein NUACC21_42450 [Scytonema sp. NUACC21]